jgi:hypothetical protein
MAKMFSALDEPLMKFIGEQKIFFTATAANAGRINLSPKGMDTFRCLDANTVAYLDLTGSGNEAAAHLLENGRMTIMFCGFADQPLILRLYGQGRTVRPRDHDWAELLPFFTPTPGQRQIVVLTIESVQTSCGFAVPRYAFQAERPTLADWSRKKGEAALEQYWRDKNTVSIDGLPTLLVED